MHSASATSPEIGADMRHADEALNRMSRGEGGGRRSSVEIYEVVLDESFG